MFKIKHLFETKKVKMRYSAISLAVRLFVLILIVYEIVKRFFLNVRFNPSSF